MLLSLSLEFEIVPANLCCNLLQLVLSPFDVLLVTSKLVVTFIVFTTPAGVFRILGFSLWGALVTSYGSF